jgi:hypothetical protein
MSDATTEGRVIEIDADMAANIAWCLIGAVMVGVVLMYGFTHRLISEAYEKGWQDARGPGSSMAMHGNDAPLDDAPATPRPSTQSAA